MFRILVRREDVLKITTSVLPQWKHRPLMHAGSIWCELAVTAQERSAIETAGIALETLS